MKTLNSPFFSDDSIKTFDDCFENVRTCLYICLSIGNISNIHIHSLLNRLNNFFARSSFFMKYSNSKDTNIHHGIECSNERMSMNSFLFQFRYLFKKVRKFIFLICSHSFWTFKYRVHFFNFSNDH